MHSFEPTIKLGGFSLWVLGRQFPDATDYWDGNWLNVRAQVKAHGAMVEAQGPIIFAAEFAEFTAQLETLFATMVGAAALRCMEPNLVITIRGEALGHIELKINITPDHMAQSHDLQLKPLQSEFHLQVIDY